MLKEALIKLIPFMLRQAQHERNQPLTVRPEPVEEFIRSVLKPITARFHGLQAR
jgi:glycerol-3-phosphate dehydrogenase (NAD(P)+)